MGIGACLDLIWLYNQNLEYSDVHVYDACDVPTPISSQSMKNYFKYMNFQNPNLKLDKKRRPNAAKYSK